MVPRSPNLYPMGSITARRAKALFLLKTFLQKRFKLRFEQPRWVFCCFSYCFIQRLLSSIFSSLSPPSFAKTPPFPSISSISVIFSMLWYLLQYYSCFDHERIRFSTFCTSVCAISLAVFSLSLLRQIWGLILELGLTTVLLVSCPFNVQVHGPCIMAMTGPPS